MCLLSIDLLAQRTKLFTIAHPQRDRLATQSVCVIRNVLPKVGNKEILSISSSVGTGTSANEAQITIDLAEQDAGRTRSIDDIIYEI